jgi:hypothetical protein
MTWFEIDCLPETDYQQFARSVLRRWGLPAIEPPSLKEQAIAVLEDAQLDAAHYNILLRALEQIHD